MQVSSDRSSKCQLSCCVGGYGCDRLCDNNVDHACTGGSRDDDARAAPVMKRRNLPRYPKPY